MSARTRTSWRTLARLAIVSAGLGAVIAAFGAAPNAQMAEGYISGVVESAQGAGAGDAMNFLHGANAGLDVFHHVGHPNVIERIGRKGIGKPVQIVDHVHPFQRHHVQADASGKLEAAATDVKALSAQSRYPSGILG